MVNRLLVIYLAINRLTGWDCLIHAHRRRIVSQSWASGISPCECTPLPSLCHGRNWSSRCASRTGRSRGWNGLIRNSAGGNRIGIENSPILVAQIVALGGGGNHIGPLRSYVNRWSPSRRCGGRCSRSRSGLRNLGGCRTQWQHGRQEDAGNPAADPDEDWAAVG